MNKKRKILVVDDVSENIHILMDILKDDYALIGATSGKKALEISNRDEKPDLILLDIMMPEMDGFEVCRQLKNTTVTEHIPVIFVTALSEIDDEAKGLEFGAVDYITKPVRAPIVKARVKAHLALYEYEKELERKIAERTKELTKTLDRLHKAHDSLRENYFSTIHIFSNLIELKAGPRVAGHSRRVAEYARKIGRAMKLDAEQQDNLLLAGLLHDIGKLGLPDKMVHKPLSTLSAQEYEKYVKHPELGEASLMALEPIRSVATIIRGHHERYDGKGFPDQLKGDEIPLAARIISIANDYDALQMGTISSQMFGPSDAADYLKRNSGTRYDPGVVEVFLGDKGLHTPREAEKRGICKRSNGLRPGMVLVRDLVADTGMLLLAKGQVIDDHMIKGIDNIERALTMDLDIYVDKF